MRVSGLLLVVVAILTTSGDAAFPDSNRLKTASADDKSGQAFMTKTSRFLRFFFANVEKSGNGNGDEERAGGNLGKLDDAVDENMSFMITMFKKWDDMQPQQIAKSLYADRATSEQSAAMLRMYNEYNQIGADALLAKLKASVAK